MGQQKLVDQGELSTFVNMLVALGTLLLAGLTVYQLRLFVQERRATRARELADRVYTPLRAEVALWQCPELVFNGVSDKTWLELKEKAPYLILRIPSELVITLNNAEPLVKRIGFLAIQVRAMIVEQTKRLGVDLCAKRNLDYRGEPLIRVLGKNLLIKLVDLGEVWSSRASLKDWVEKYVEEHYPVRDWEVEVLSGSDRLGGLKEAEEMNKVVFNSLSCDPFACELLEKIYEFKELAKKAFGLIDEQLSKPVAPWE